MSRRYARGHPCPTVSKRAYDDEETALGELAILAHSSRPKNPVRAYRCRCGKWHLTSRPRYTEASA